MIFETPRARGRYIVARGRVNDDIFLTVEYMAEVRR